MWNFVKEEECCLQADSSCIARLLSLVGHGKVRRTKFLLPAMCTVEAIASCQRKMVVTILSHKWETKRRLFLSHWFISSVFLREGVQNEYLAEFSLLIIASHCQKYWHTWWSTCVEFDEPLDYNNQRLERAPLLGPIHKQIHSK